MEEDAIVGVYCHHDGYPSYLGDVLLNNYKDLDVWKLIALGDMSAAGKTLDKCDPYAECEEPETLMPRFHHDLNEIYHYQSDFEYVYLWNPKDRKWYYNRHADGRELKELTEKVIEED